MAIDLMDEDLNMAGLVYRPWDEDLQLIYVYA